MAFYPQYRQLVHNLLRDSPILSETVIEDVQLLLAQCEVQHAFDTLCSWIFEDEHAISRQYYDRLVEASVLLEITSAVERLDELIRD